jgi:large subunit ribosomal protein L4
MTVQKFVTYSVLETNGQTSSENQKLELKVLENSGNYLIHKDIKRHQILNKQGTVSTKTRSEVRGGGRKPWRQKGTGRARAGSNRSPLWKGGGVIFGPKPRTVKHKLNRKEFRLALKTLLFNRKDKTIVVDKWDIPDSKTKNFIQLINRLDKTLDSKTLVILSKPDKNVQLACKNIESVETILATNLNIKTLIRAQQIFIDQEALKVIEDTYSGN